MDSPPHHINKCDDGKNVIKQQDSPPAPGSSASSASSGSTASCKSPGSTRSSNLHGSPSSPGTRQGFTESPSSSGTSSSEGSTGSSDSNGSPMSITPSENHAYAQDPDPPDSTSSSSSGWPKSPDSPRAPRSSSPSPPTFGLPPYYYPPPPSHASSSSSNCDENGSSPAPSPFPSPSPPPPSPPRPARQGFLLQGINLPYDIDTLSDAAAMAQLLIQDGNLERFTGFKSPLAKRVARRLVGFLNEPYLWSEGANGGDRVWCEEARIAVLNLVGCEHYNIRVVRVLGENVEWIRPAPIIERIVGGKGDGGRKLGDWTGLRNYDEE